MKKKKIYVYAISKNEEKFAKRWYESVKSADGIYVLDTGSTDNTVKILKELGAKVTTKEIKPWRFDVARNESLKLVPLDADIWSHDENKNPKVSFYYEKIHARKNFKWINPVHEVLKYTGSNEVWATTNDIIVDHYPDSSKSRSSYLPLLELSVKEDPYNDRNVHYLGREYMYYGKLNEAIDTLIYHLSLKSATWKDERAASMRFIARCYKYLKRYEEAKMWFNKAINEAPYLRDAYVEMAFLEYELNNFSAVKKYCLLALNIKTHEKTYINEPFSFDYTIYDLLSISTFYLGEIDESLKWVDIAIKMEPNNKRLLNNKKLILRSKKEF